MNAPGRFQKIALEPLENFQVQEWARRMRWDGTLTEREVRRLQFIRWLVQTGKLSEWS